MKIPIENESVFTIFTHHHHWIFFIVINSIKSKSVGCEGRENIFSTSTDLRTGT
jgi:hypothetical protein